MTIEVRELVIKANIDDANITPASHFDKLKEEESRLIALISKHILDQLREERGREI